MPNIEFFNSKAKFFVGTEKAVIKPDPFKRLYCTILGTFISNYYDMERKWYIIFLN